MIVVVVGVFLFPKEWHGDEKPPPPLTPTQSFIFIKQVLSIYPSDWEEEEEDQQEEKKKNRQWIDFYVSSPY